MNFYLGSPREFGYHFNNEATPYEVALFKPITDNYREYGFIGDMVMDLYLSNNYGNLRKRLYASVGHEGSPVYDPKNYMSWLILFLSNNSPWNRLDEYTLCAKKAFEFAPPDKKEDVRNLLLTFIKEEIDRAEMFKSSAEEEIEEEIQYYNGLKEQIEKL